MIQFLIIGIHQKRSPGKGSQLCFCGQNDDIFFSHFPDHLRRQLLVSAAKEVSLAAGDGNDHLCPLPLYIGKELLTAEIIGHQLLIPDQIHADQRVLKAQNLHDPPGGGSGPNDIIGIRLHLPNGLISNGFHGRRIR